MRALSLLFEKDRVPSPFPSERIDGTALLRIRNYPSLLCKEIVRMGDAFPLRRAEILPLPSK